MPCFIVMVVVHAMFHSDTYHVLVMVAVCAMFHSDGGCMRYVLCFIVIVLYLPCFMVMVAVCAMFHSDGSCMCHVS